MHILQITLTIIKEDVFVLHAETNINDRRENSMSNTITYAGAVWMIAGWTVGRIIGMFIIDRMDKNDVL